MTAAGGSRRSRFGPFHMDRDSRLEGANDDSTCVTDLPLASEYGTTRLVRYGTATYGHVRGKAARTTSGTAAAAATLVVSTSPSDDGRTTLLLQPATTTSPHLVHSIHRHHPHHSLLFQDYGCCADVVSSPSTVSTSGNRLLNATGTAAGSLADEGYASRPPSYAVFFSSSQSSNSSSGRPVTSRKKDSSSTGSYDVVNPSCDSGESGSSDYAETPAVPEVFTVTSDAIDGSLHSVRSTPIMTSRSHAYDQPAPLCQTKQQAIYFVQSTTQANTSTKNSLRSQHHGNSSDVILIGRDNQNATTEAGDVSDGGRWRNGDRAICDLTSTVSGVMATPQQNNPTSGMMCEFEVKGDNDKKNVAIVERLGMSSPVRRNKLIDTSIV